MNLSTKELDGQDEMGPDGDVWMDGAESVGCVVVAGHKGSIGGLVTVTGSGTSDGCPHNQTPVFRLVFIPARHITSRTSSYW